MATTSEFLHLTAAQWAAIASIAAVLALGFNAWSSISAKLAAEAASRTAERSLQVQAAGLPVDFRAMIIVVFSELERSVRGAPILVENTAPAPVFVHRAILESFNVPSRQHGQLLAQPHTLFERSPAQLLHFGELVTGGPPNSIT